MLPKHNTSNMGQCIAALNRTSCPATCKTTGHKLTGNAQSGCMHDSTPVQVTNAADARHACLQAEARRPTQYAVPHNDATPRADATTATVVVCS
jgi:hypothetical protein